MSSKTTLLFVGVLAVGIGYTFYNSQESTTLSIPTTNPIKTEEITVLKQDKETQNPKTNAVDSGITEKTSIKRVETKTRTADAKAKKKDKTLKDKNYQEIFVTPDTLSKVEVMQEHKALAEIEAESHVLMSKADAFIEEKGLAL